MGTKNARKCNNDVRAYTPRSSTTGRKDTKANRALRQNRSRPVAPAWLGKRISAVRANTVPFSIIFQFQVLSLLQPSQTSLNSKLGKIVPTAFTPALPTHTNHL